MRHSHSLPALFSLLLSGLLLNGCSSTSETQVNPSDPVATQALLDSKPSSEVLDERYHDLDEDQIADKQDLCPNSRLKGSVNVHGCENDQDADGVYDRIDQCPDTPLGTEVNFLGCPPDDDRDGVPNAKDECPDTPEGTPVDERGCPLERDNDGDGVFNEDDQCPDTPAGAVVNEYGCVPQTLVLSNIVFAFNSSEISADQQKVLLQNASQLKSLKSTEILLVTGHTDSIGSREYNMKLSWQRANSAKDFLLEQARFKDDEVVILGKGEEVPIADNMYSDGRAQNRRIELKVIPRTEIPDDAATRLPAAFME